MALMGDNEYVRDFSHAAQLVIIERIEQAEDSDHDQIDWTAWFQSANEVSYWCDVPMDTDDVITLPYGGYLWFD